MDPNEQQQQPSWTGGDAPDKEKMEQIRARRLAMLGSAAPKQDENKSPSAEPSKPSSSSSTPKPQASEPEQPKPSSTSSTPNPFSQLGVRSNGSGTDQPKSTSGTLPRHPRKRPATDVDEAGGSGAPPAQRKTNPPTTESDEDYVNRVITQIFRVTANPHAMVNSAGHKLKLLPDMNEEMNSDGRTSLKLTIEDLDQVIMEAGRNCWPRNTPLIEYMLPCWKRATKAVTQSKATEGPRREVLEEAKRLSLSYCLFGFTLPDLFDREADSVESLVPYVLRGVFDENGLDLEFYKEAIKRFDDDEAIPTLFTDVMVKISTQLATKSMEDDYKPYVNALQTYTKFNTLLNNLAQHPTFVMAQSAPGIEKHTFLGPFFRLSPLQHEVIKSYFPGPRTLDKARIANAQDSLRMVLRTHQDDLFTIANSFIRAGAATRSRTLDWFAYIMNTNHKRRAMQVDPRTVASDGFMMNVTTILDRFCEPFMDNDFSKVDKIDVKYFKRNPRVDIKDETKINADQAAADEFYSQKEEGESNFISEAFFLTLAAHHYGSEAANSQLKNIDREIKYLEKHIKSMEAERPKMANSPQLRMFEESLKRHTSVLEKAISLKYALEGALLDERMQSTSLRFMRYVAVWLLRLATGSDYKPGNESEQIKLPLTIENNSAFSCLPEYILQNIVDNFKFVFRWLPKILLSAVGEELIALCITLLRSSEYVRNPYVKSSLVTLLFSGTWPFMHLKKGVLGDQLVSIKFANDYLLHALMKFYIECESTGANSAFYDKFNIRYEIFQVIKCVWVNDVYRQQLNRESKVNKAFFVRFVNMLLNDATYVLDEAFTKFPKIRALELELKNDASLNGEARQKKEEELQTLGNQATSYMQLANETLEMMKLFTEALGESFTMPEIVIRLASMLNYNLETLAGKKAAAELSVEDKAKYHFKPIQLISDFVEIYLNLGSSKVFIDAVASDGRSYKPEVLDRVSRILQSKHQMDPADIARWDKLKAKFLASKEELDQAELDLGDIPAEFEDPIMGILMTDPVLLPSQHIVDRSTIAQHLLSDPKDPYTRQPMTVDDAVPQDELRGRIEEWRKEKIQAAKQEAMDTTEG